MGDTMIMLPNPVLLVEPSFSEFVLQTNPSILPGSTQVCSNSNFKTWQHVRQSLFGKNISVVTIGDRKYLIGVQIAKLLKRETFNLYRSMKVKGIEIIRAVSDQVEYLMRVSAVKRGTRSVTLIAYDPTVEFVECELQRIQKSEGSPMRKDSDSNDSDSLADAEMSYTPPTRKRSSSSMSAPSVEVKRTRSSDESENFEEESWGYNLPQPWEILLSLANGRFKNEEAIVM